MMETQVPEHHPLRTLFGTLTERSFTETLGWPDFNVTDYLSNLLVEFSHIDRIQHIKNQQGESVETVVELLYETETLHEGSPQERERELHRHIGDLTLFIMGLFPEYLKFLKARGIVYHKDYLVDYVKAGKRSYGIVATFEQGEFKEHRALFQKLSTNFELCVTGLGLVRQDLNRLQNPPFPQAHNALPH